MKIGDEDAYPIYKINVKWGVKAYAPQWLEECGPDHWSFKGLPEGMQWNTTGTTIMFKDATDQVQPALDVFVTEFRSHHPEINNEYFKAEIVFLRHEVWCEGWFSHWTFDVGQTDDEILKSFSDYVHRIQQYNQKNGKIAYFSDGRSYWDEPICLMGAEDEWRWQGKDRSDPPCRCDDCKKHGVIRIDH